MKHKILNPYEISTWLPEQTDVIGIAGPMASGKNYVSSLLEKQGWHSIDADLLVHKAIEKAADQIYETFSPYEKQAEVSIKNQSGKIDRRALGKILFSNPQLLAKQEEIIYPIITEEIKTIISENPKVIINATVLYKTPELLSLCKYILFVHSPFFKRLFRAAKRDKLPLKQILKRFSAQKNLLKKYESALNNSTSQIIIIKN